MCLENNLCWLLERNTGTCHFEGEKEDFKLVPKMKCRFLKEGGGGGWKANLWGGAL